MDQVSFHNFFIINSCYTSNSYKSKIQNVKKVNKTKQQLRKLFTNLDQNKEDVLPESAFFEILSLNSIELNARDKALLTQKAKGASVKLNNAVRYRDALTMINIDHELAREGRDPFVECWIFRPVGSTVMDSV